MTNKSYDANAGLNEAQKIMNGFYKSETKNEEEAEAQRWDGLEDIYNGCSKALTEARKGVIEIFSIPGIKENIQDRTGTANALRGLNKDITYFSEELTKIHERHAGKTGVIANEEELANCLSVFEEYHEFNDKYFSVIVPVISLISEEVGASVEAIRLADEAAKKNVTSEQDASVVSDVEIKEVVAVEQPAQEEVTVIQA